MTVHALCPNCGATVLDTGKQRFIVCNKCGRKIQSRVYGIRATETYHDEQNAMLTELEWRRSREYNDGPHWPSALRSVGGFLCSFAIISVILILLINFIAFFPAIYITAPELLNKHQIEHKTEVPLTIDNTPPRILNVNPQSINSTPGQLINLSMEIVERNLRECCLELIYNSNGNTMQNIIHSLRFDENTNRYFTFFQAPEIPGVYQPTIRTTDYAGNTAYFQVRIEVRSSTKPVLSLISPMNYGVVNSSTILKFTSGISNITSASFILDDETAINPLIEPYSISTSDWSEGSHELNLIFQSSTGEENSLNFSIIIDDSTPKLTSLAVTPLTLNRNETFRSQLDENTYYRGEFVNLIVSVQENNFHEAKVILGNNSYPLVPIKNEASSIAQDAMEYQAIFSMPHEPGEHKLRVLASDLAGNRDDISYTFDVARINFDYIPVPILSLELSSANSKSNLPIINSSTHINLPIKYGKLVDIHFIYDNDTNTNIVQNGDSINLTKLSEGDGKLGVNAEVTYHYWDYLFISLPYPPYLFVLPIVITGWALVGFFIFIALVIIISNLYLFKSSYTKFIQLLESALKGFRAPMMESKNSMIMLAQLFLAVISFNFLYNQILAWGQVPVRTPDFSSLSDWAFIYNLTTAAVYEEIISRILLIGIPLFIIHAFNGKLSKQKSNYLLGGGFEINKITIILIIFSSLTFGLAHAPGWDYWKVIPTFITGFALGYLFIRKGVFAAILLHFTVNFLTIPLRLINYQLGPTLLFSFLFIFWIVIGLVYIGYYIHRISRLFKKNEELIRARA